jgi:membrane protein
MPAVSEWKDLLVKTWTEWNEDQAPRLGAALAYYTVLSLAPLLILMIAIAGLVFGEEAARGQLLSQIQGLVGSEGGEAIQTMVQNASKPGSGIVASIIGFAVLIFGASTVANELKLSLNQIWDVDPNAAGSGVKDMVKQRSKALIVVLGCGFLLLVSLAVSSTIAAAGSFMANLLPLPEVVLQVLNLLLGILVITGVFAFMFRYLPDVDIEWRDVWLGALFTSVLFSIGKFAIGLYLGKASLGSTYGAAGSLVIVLVWVYYSSQILFFGAEFTQVYSETHGSRQQRSKQPQTQTGPTLVSSKGKTDPLAEQTAGGNAGLTSAPEEKAAGFFGSLVGSALAASKIVRGFRH